MGSYRIPRKIVTEYDEEQDILYLCFTDQAKEAFAEEIGGDAVVRFDPETRDIVTVEFLNFSSRLEKNLGKDFKFDGSQSPEMLFSPLLEG